MFLFAGLVHRLREILGKMKTVMDDLGLRQHRLGRLGKGLPHVHGDRLHFLPLCRRKAVGKQRFGRLHRASLNHIQDPSPHAVAQNRDVLVSLLYALLVQGGVLHHLLAAPAGKTPKNRPVHQVMDRRRRQT